MRWALALLAFWPLTAFGQSLAATVWENIDFCAPYVERADVIPTGGGCGWSLPQQTIADDARFVTLSGESNVSSAALPDSVDPTNPSGTNGDASARVPKSCLANNFAYWESLKTMADSLQALRPAGRSPIQFEIRVRPDLAYFTELATTGFDQDWIVDADTGATPWATMLDLLDSTGSSDFDTGGTNHAFGNQCSEDTECTGGGGQCGADGCAYTADIGSTDHQIGAYVDALGSPNDHQSKVLYLLHIKGAGDEGITGDGNNPRHPYPVTAVGDLSNASYRAWKISQLQDAMTVLGGSVQAVNVGIKPGQYYCRIATGGTGVDARKRATPEWWIGGNGHMLAASGWSDRCSSGTNTFATHQAYYDSGNTPFTAKPLTYGYPEYMAGLLAFTQGLTAAGIPYTMAGDRKVWWPETYGPAAGGGVSCAVSTNDCSHWDDEETAADENQMFKDAMLGARRVYMPAPTNNLDYTSEAAMEAELATAGVELAYLNAACGKTR